MWTPAALASSARRLSGRIWRVVEHQHTIATRKIVDTLDEQAVLEDILEETKPPYPPAAEHLHYLLKTPFRYAPSPYASRFRPANDSRGIFYGAESVRTGLAEVGYWRRRFLAASPGTPPPRNPESLTTFSVDYRSRHALDLFRPPLDRDRALWMHPEDYTATHALALNAREVGIEAIRYESVRAPGHEACLALLEPAAFVSSRPVEMQTWYLFLGEAEISCIRAGQSETYTFPAETI